MNTVFYKKIVLIIIVTMQTVFIHKTTFLKNNIISYLFVDFTEEYELGMFLMYVKVVVKLVLG